MEQDPLSQPISKKSFPAWASIAVFFILCSIFSGIFSMFLFIGYALVYGEPGATDASSIKLGTVMLTEIILLLGVLLSAGIVLFIEKRSFSVLGLLLKGHKMDIIYGALVAGILYAVGFGCSWVLGLVEVKGIHFDAGDLALSWLFFLTVALAEEIAMRGYVLGRLLRTSLNKYLSLFISSLCFALLHIFNPNVAVLPMINLVLAGMLLGATYIYTRNLWFPIGLHLFWNWIQGPILGYRVSGNDFGTSLLSLELPENNVWNGGEFGFEGSLVCTILIIVATLIIFRWGERKERNL